MVGERGAILKARILGDWGMRNLLVAGRCISSTHEAQASYRITPFCAGIGQAAGCAAALAVGGGVPLCEIDRSVMQQILRSEGFVL